MSYTCNKKAYPDFKEDCLQCSEYNPCVKGGKWCFVAVAEMVGKREEQRIVPTAANTASMNCATPLLQPHDYRNIKIDANTTVTIDLEDLKAALEQSHFPSMFMGGA